MLVRKDKEQGGRKAKQVNDMLIAPNVQKVSKLMRTQVSQKTSGLLRVRSPGSAGRLVKPHLFGDDVQQLVQSPIGAVQAGGQSRSLR